MAKAVGGLDLPVNESQGGTNASTFNNARTNMGLNALINAQTIGYTALTSDRNKLIHYTGAGGVTLGFDAAATLLNGWAVVVRNDSATSITLNPNGAELINGAATLSLEPSQAVIVYCDGVGFYTEGEALQRLALSGGTMTGALILNADPTLALGAATKQYVDALAAGFDIKSPCLVATTASLTAIYVNGAAGVGATLTNSGALAAFSVDGVSPAINSRVLVKDQGTTFQNGIYTLTVVGSGAVAWVLTRATDYDQVAEIFPGNFILINSGTINANSAWIQTATVATIGTDPISFSQFGVGDFAPSDATYIVQTASGGLSAEQALGALATGLVKNTTVTGVLSIAIEGTDYYGPGGTDIPVTDGGTGVSTLTTPYGVLTAGTTATGPVQTLPSLGNSGDVLTSGGAGVLPSFLPATSGASTSIGLAYLVGNGIFSN